MQTTIYTLAMPEAQNVLDRYSELKRSYDYGGTPLTRYKKAFGEGCSLAFYGAGATFVIGALLGIGFNSGAVICWTWAILGALGILGVLWVTVVTASQELQWRNLQRRRRQLYAAGQLLDVDTRLIDCWWTTVSVRLNPDHPLVRELGDPARYGDLFHRAQAALETADKLPSDHPSGAAIRRQIGWLMQEQMSSLRERVLLLEEQQKITQAAFAKSNQEVLAIEAAAALSSLQ